MAQRSAQAAKEIKGLISASAEHVKSGVDLVGQTGRALHSIVGRVSEISGLIGEMSASAQEHATALAEVNTAVNQLDHVTQQNAAMVEQSAGATHTLGQEAAELNRQVRRFKIRARSGRARLDAAAPSSSLPLEQASARISEFAVERDSQEPSRQGLRGVAAQARRPP